MMTTMSSESMERRQEMKKVYVVANDCTHEYENVYEIVGIFSTREKAQHLLDNQDEDDFYTLSCIFSYPF